MERYSVPLQVSTLSALLFTEPSEDTTDSTGSEFIATPELSASSGESSFLTVPPTTPNSRYSFTHIIETLQRPFPKPDSLQVPYVREIGVKATIDVLSQFFSCPNYKLNAIQFWFLDILADCLWKLQDEFRFPEPYQKVILEWVLYVVELIGDPRRNLTRREFFQMFNEALEIAEEQVQSGCDMVPSPDGLFTWLHEDEEEQISFHDSTKSASVATVSNAESLVGVGIDEESVQWFGLPKRKQECYRDFSSPVDGDLTSETRQKEDEEHEEVEHEENKEDDFVGEDSSDFDDTVEFYQPNLKIPERFLSSSSTPSSEHGSSSTTTETRFMWRRSFPPADKLKKDCFADSPDSTSEQHPTSEVTPTPRSVVKEEWESFLKNREEAIHNMEKNILINSCALFAIKDFVHDYFYESFQFTMVKLALINNYNFITHQINTKWNIPKVLKQELKRPKEKKVKEKKVKEKKPKEKKEKSAKKEKKEKVSKKDSKKTKSEKEKKKVPTKEEKEEMQRLKREQERLEEEQRKAEENRRLLIPLNEATDDNFYKSIFDHWVRPKQQATKADKKGKKKK